MDLSVIIPCYNELENVPLIHNELLPVLAKLASTQSVEIIFVDDGCTDGTIEAVKALSMDKIIPGLVAKYEDNHGNWGLGKALRTGFTAASGEVIVTTDSDGTYKFSSIPLLVSFLGEAVDIVTASPYHPQGGVAGVPAYRLILSKGSSLIYRMLVSRRVHTYTCLFRAYRRKVVRDVPFISNGFLAGTELLVKSMLKGYQVAEYPAVLYRRTYGTSKAKLVRTIRDHLSFQWSVLLHRVGLLSLVEKDGKWGGRRWIRTKYSVPQEFNR